MQDLRGLPFLKYYPELCITPASYLHQCLLRQLGSLKGHRTAHVGCDWISETVARTRRSLKAIQIDACLGVTACEGACGAD